MEPAKYWRHFMAPKEEHEYGTIVILNPLPPEVAAAENATATIEIQPEPKPEPKTGLTSGLTASFALLVVFVLLWRNMLDY